MNKKKEKALDNLNEFVVTESSVECTYCGVGEMQYADNDPEYFYDLGWRATRSDCYCPKCAKKRLKNLK